MARWYGYLFHVFLLVLCAGAASAQGIPGLPGSETPEAAPAADPIAAEQLSARLAAVTAQIETTDDAIGAADEQRDEHLITVRDRLRAIASVLEQAISLAEARDSDGDEGALAPSAPPSVFALNDLYEARFALEFEAANRERQVEVTREALESARERIAAGERQLRDARRALESASPEEKPAARRALELRELEQRLAQETVALRTLETRAAVADRERGGSFDELDARIDAMRQALARGEGDSIAGFAELAERAGAVRRQREATARRLAIAELRLQAAQNRFAQQAIPPPELFEEVELLTARRDAIRQQIALADAQLERIAAQRDVWRQWEALLRGNVSGADLDAWERSASERIEGLAQAEVQRDARVSDLEARLEALEIRPSAAVGEGLRSAVENLSDTLRRAAELQRAEGIAVATDRRLSERFLADIHGETGHIDLLAFAARGAEAVGDVWAYEITTVDDAPITTGSLVLALFFFAIGLWAARRGSSVVARVAEDRLRLDPGACQALGTLSFYVLLVGFTLLALRAIHFPLTAFTVLGGALAIGIGFGSQNVMNNFISGLILMLERPVRARDLIEVDGNHGRVENIGARSTQIRSVDGRHIIVPNSFFLETNVVNWTLSDDLIRAKVSVGVIYGSPTRLVEQLIRRVVDEDDRVLKQPAPIIVFEDFGDNSLNFDAYFWVRARSPMDMRQVQSGVRFRIDDLFREHDLVIAFPQRDVHLDSDEPIEVRVLNG